MEVLITRIFEEEKSIKIILPFVLNDLNKYFIEGKIQVKYKGVELNFDVIIPKVYPYTFPNVDNISVVFKNEDLIGFTHVNNDGSVCFHPDKDDNFERKLKAEINGLKEWIYKYYICRKEDNHYTYLIHNTDNPYSTLFFSDNNKKFKKGDFGTFAYSQNTNYKFKDRNTQTFYKIGFDKDNEDKWASNFSQRLKLNINWGIWTYIETEPAIKKLGYRKGISNWQELEKYLSNDFIKFLYDSFNKFNKKYFFENELFLLLGYKIPNNENYETHWDLIKIPKNKLPIETVSIPKEKRINSREKYVGYCKSDKIIWGNTVNSNYNRFFGRGKLSDKLVNAKILIIGCGALGSSLAEILVRGGCKKIILEDFDTIKSGNLCRSKYNLSHINISKTESLNNYLSNISPFVEINEISFKMSFFQKLEEGLNQTVDYIFDCSTDTEVTNILDGINFKGQIFSLSITNKAKNLVCVSGQNITKTTKHFFDFLGNEPPSFFEGTGCGYPTFEANYNHINTLLNLGIKNINYKIDKSIQVQNFIINNEISENSCQVNLFEYKDFYESLTQNYLYISNQTLNKIENELRKHYPNEFGGIFIGNICNKVIFINDILIPDEYENGTVVFVRHPGTLNERLKYIYNKSKGRTTYIGEWHSHPNASAIPSNTDKEAMRNISKDINIGNGNPVLMIVKLTEELFEPQFYIYNEEKLLNYD